MYTSKLHHNFFLKLQPHKNPLASIVFSHTPFPSLQEATMKSQEPHHHRVNEDFYKDLHYHVAEEGLTYIFHDVHAISKKKVVTVHVIVELEEPMVTLLLKI
ncbi:hypothetical protein Lalb_Chr08g0234771 [Lupinus albus]|uniref:Uncharacterized protein n=1 Tax=Lupinus albus TaxID=3870 RepID=A0A6A4Q4A4_LUPAL|nr:hypothetical protein Lalb_Chr08g0234771 [Lupinus albus]